MRPWKVRPLLITSPSGSKDFPSVSASWRTDFRLVVSSTISMKEHWRRRFARAVPLLEGADYGGHRHWRFLLQGARSGCAQEMVLRASRHWLQRLGYVGAAGGNDRLLPLQGGYRLLRRRPPMDAQPPRRWPR